MVPPSKERDLAGGRGLAGPRDHLFVLPLLSLRDFVPFSHFFHWGFLGIGMRVWGDFRLLFNR